MKARERILSLKSRTASAVARAGVSAISSFILLIIIFSLTTPMSAGPFGILVVFVLLYILFLSLLFILLIIGLAVANKMGVRLKGDGRRLYYVASVLGFVPIFYLMLVSMGGVSFWGVFLIIVFVALSLFYVLRRL